MPTAQSAPSSFVEDLTDPGLWIVPMSDWVGLRKYLCADAGNGGNAKAAQLRNAIRAVVKGTEDEPTIHQMGAVEYERVFSGQGKPENFSILMHLIWYNKEKFKAYKDATGKTILAKYFDQINPLQAMVDDAMFGMDCIGFVGRYLEDAGIFPTYLPLYPRHYMDRFFPIQQITHMEDLCVIVWVNGTHIAIIDKVRSVNTNRTPSAVVDICQSSSGGPQLNTRVQLEQTSGEYLDFGEYGKAVDGHNVSESEKSQLRKDLIKRGSVGYRGGLMFNIKAGSPQIPVTGHVYVGRLPNLMKGWTEIELD